MEKYNTFYDFKGSYDESKYIIFGVLFDITSSFRTGSRWGPNSMRKICYNLESYNYFYNIDMNNINVCDLGNIIPSYNMKEAIDEIYLETQSIMVDNKIPIMIGGEHSITYASVMAFKEKYKDDSLIIILDAHLDMKIEFDGIQFSHACVSRNIYNNLTNNIILLGVHSGTKEEWDFIIQEKIEYFTSEDIKNIGIDKIIDNILKKHSNKKIYLSIDLDVIDPIYCPGVGTPEPFGITPYEVKKIINKLSKLIYGLDIVELNPEYDREISSIVATKLLREFIYSKEYKNDI